LLPSSGSAIPLKLTGSVMIMLQASGNFHSQLIFYHRRDELVGTMHYAFDLYF
jgi:hypothetical protein